MRMCTGSVCVFECRCVGVGGGLCVYEYRYRRKWSPLFWKCILGTADFDTFHVSVSR